MSNKKRSTMLTDPVSFLVQEERETPVPVEWIAPHLLTPYPRQAAIYGEEDVAELIEDIRTSGWIKPLVVTQQDVIISGHRRWKAACLLNWRTLPVERRTFASEVDEVAALLLENRYREKTAEQRVREGNVWKEVEKARAYQRKREAVNARWQGIDMKNFSYLERGLARDKVAERVGFGSGLQYAKAAKVVGRADALSAEGKLTEADTLLTVLNTQSVDAAAGVLKLDEAAQVAVLQKLAEGDCTRVKEAVLSLKKEAVEAQMQAAPTKPRLRLASWQDWLPEQPLCDLLLTDPPYSTDVEDIDAFVRAWLPVALAKVKPTGRAYVCIGAYPHELRAYLQATTCFPVGQILVWRYQNTIGPAPTHAYKHNWQAILSYRGPEAPPLDCPLLIEQMSVMQINTPDGRQGERYHTWQKPDALAERLIRHATRPGDLVLDCFAGTGTFVLAAHRLGRRALGCDHSAEMLALAQRRGCEISDEVQRLLAASGLDLPSTQLRQAHQTLVMQELEPSSDKTFVFLSTNTSEPRHYPQIS